MSTNNENLTAEQRANLAVFGEEPPSSQQMVERQAQIIEAGAREIIESKPRHMQKPLIRALNKENGSPFDKDDLRRLHVSLTNSFKERDREGSKPLIGIEAILGAVKSLKTGYLIKYLVPRSSFTIVAGAPKVGKTSIIVAMLIRAFLGEEGVTGLKSKSFSHLTIYSDDQAPADTGRYVNGSLQGLDDPSASVERLKEMDLNIYPSLTLDEDGAERLTQQAAAKPGGVFLIDSLTSCGSKLGYNENDSDVSRIIYDLRESIQSVDPSATVILIHHMKKGGTGNSSQVDSVRGSGAITGAVDNVLTIERPMVPKGGASVAQDMTNDRVIHLVGRTVGETKVVVRSDFDFGFTYDKESDDEIISLNSIKMNYLCNFEEYEALAEESAVETKRHTDWLTQSQWDLLLFLNGKKNPQLKKHIPGATSTVSTAINALLAQTPALVVESTDSAGKTVYSTIPNVTDIWSKVIPNPNPADF